MGRRAIRDPFPRQFSPRIGLAYTLDSQTVIRAAYGVFYAIPPYSVNSHFTMGYDSQTMWTATADGVTPLNLLKNPFPAGFSPVTGSSAGLLTNIGVQPYGGWPQNLKTPYNLSWNFTVRRSLGKDLMMEVAYAGNKATNLPIVLQRYNVLSPQQLQQYGDRIFEQVANPFYGYIPATAGALAGRTIAFGQSLKPDPQYLNRGAYVNTTGASANYHALQARFEKRFSAGLSILGSYTWSKTLTDASGGSGFFDSYWNDIRDWTCIRCDYGLAVHGQPHRLVASFTYELPAGKGKRLGSSWSRALDLLLGQRQGNGIATFSKGLPLRFTTATNTAYAGVTASGGNQTPDSTGRNADLGSSRSIDRWFDTSQFPLPARYTFGTLGRVHPNLREDGASHIDLSLFKSFRIGERFRTELRAEAFNLTNTPLFSAPNTTFGSSSFGRVSGQQNDPRQVQLALRVMI